MVTFPRYVLNLFFCFSFFLSFFVFAGKNIVIKESHNADGSVWKVNKSEEGYGLEYVSARGKVYINNSIITSDVTEGSLFFTPGSGGGLSIALSYPRDEYSFDFAAGEVPRLLSACKEIKLSPPDIHQAISLITLCAKGSVIGDGNLSNIDGDNILEQKNLYLKEKVSTLITADKSFLFDEDKKQIARKPYLIKGDVVEIVDYNNSWVNVKYKSKTKYVTAWVKLVDVL